MYEAEVLCLVIVDIAVEWFSQVLHLWVVLDVIISLETGNPD